MKKFIQEFKEFALKGNMMDLAIGMIIGSAFTGIVNSLVNDIINPILGIFTGKIDFSNLFLTLDGSHYETLDAAEKAGAAVFKYREVFEQTAQTGTGSSGRTDHKEVSVLYV